MEEFIKRDIALTALCQVSAPTPTESYIVEKCVEQINNIPADDAEPVVHARWEICTRPGYFVTSGNPDKYAKCTNCGFTWNELYDAKIHFKGCPNCRAKMDVK